MDTRVKPEYDEGVVAPKQIGPPLAGRFCKIRSPDY